MASADFSASSFRRYRRPWPFRADGEISRNKTHFFRPAGCGFTTLLRLGLGLRLVLQTCPQVGLVSAFCAYPPNFASDFLHPRPRGRKLVLGYLVPPNWPIGDFHSRPCVMSCVQSGRGGTPPLPHHEACRLLALRGFRSLAPFVQRVLGFSSRRIRFGTLRPYLGTPLRRLLSPSFHGLPLCFSCPSSVRSKSLNGLRIQPFATLRQLLWPLLTSPRPSPVIADELVLSPRRRDLLE